jgi:hypothetical protein
MIFYMRGEHFPYNFPPESPNWGILKSMNLGGLKHSFNKVY